MSAGGRSRPVLGRMIRSASAKLTRYVVILKIGRVPPYRLLYRLGIAPWDNTPGPQVLDRVLADDSAGVGRRALDVGCGRGRDAIHLVKKGWEVTAVERTTEGIRSLAQTMASSSSSPSPVTAG
jgi:2-polyprenyl-3-methyl-5-hydroxy-6-metoxy-1,4-benzoquinol methylase